MTWASNAACRAAVASSLAALVAAANCSGSIVTNDPCSPACGAGQECRDGVCVTVDPCAGTQCPPGTACLAGACMAEDDPCFVVECPNPSEVCQDGVCVSGQADGDGDGATAFDDCDDSDPGRHPGAPDLCNGVDDDCSAATVDGAADCAGRCCGTPAACRDCCAPTDCGPGDWTCDAAYRCGCAGTVSGTTCVVGGECAGPADCGPGDWTCVSARCECDGVVSGTTCTLGAECVVPGDCGAGDWTCVSDRCECDGVVSGTVCEAGGECTVASDCGAGDWACPDRTCVCAGLECGTTCTLGGECCDDSDCRGDLICSVEHWCVCGCTFCDGVCYGTAPCCSFDDVAPTDDAYEAVQMLCDMGITAGCGGGNYCPDEATSRDQMAVLLVRAMGETPSAAGASAYFDDIAGAGEAVGAINRIYELGITAGCGTRAYCPFNAVDRAQAALFVMRALGESESAAATSAYFDDLGAVPAYVAAINRLYEIDVVEGCAARRYCPLDLLSRAQAALLLARAFLCL